MASSCDRLSQAANVMQVTGVDAFGLVSMIVQAAHTARRNRDLCQQLAQHVQIVGDLLRKLQIPELKRHPETRRPLEQLDDALFRAYKLVRSCSQYQENSSQFYQMFTGADVASKLRAAQEEIDRYIHLIPMITLVAAVHARGTEEVQEDVTNDTALAQRPRLSLQEVTESLALEDLLPTGLPVDQEARRNDWHLMIDNVTNGFVDWGGRYLSYGAYRQIWSIYPLEDGRFASSKWRNCGLSPIYSLRKVKGFFQEAPEDAEIPLREVMDNEFEKGTGPRRFSYNELSQATQGFSDKQKLGEGGFGAVYRGFFHDQGLHVAIKRVSNTSRQGKREYIAEVTIISRLRHRNLVQLVGWCHEADELLLVYELLTNGSLETHLHNSGDVLTWPIRYKIILGMGSALLYLHQECEQIVVHRDIKPSNVMLDSSLNAKLGDFGLARLIDRSDAAFTTVPTGTLGYIDPQFMFTGRASAECDVYSFGVVLLEIACGRKPTFYQEDESMVYLVHWVWGMYEREALLDAADARLNGEFEAHEMERALVVGLWCVHPDYSFRPSIWQAMNVLHQFEAPLPDLPRVMPVPIYEPPAGGYRSSYTSSAGTSDRTACSSVSSAKSRCHGTHSLGTASSTTATSVSTSTPYQTANFESTDSS